jgi:hypothetical protein
LQLANLANETVTNSLKNLSAPECCFKHIKRLYRLSAKKEEVDAKIAQQTHVRPFAAAQVVVNSAYFWFKYRLLRT